MKAEVSNSFSENTSDDQRPTIRISFWLGMRGGHEDIWNGKIKKENKQKKQHPGTKLETSEIKMVWMKEHKRPKSRTDHLNSGSSAMNSQRSAHSYLVYFVRGSCSDDFSVSKSRVQCFRLYSTRKRRSPKKHNFFSFITWPQSQSVHKAVSLQPEKFKKKKSENQTSQWQTTEFRKVVKKQISCSLKMETVIIPFCSWEIIAYFFFYQKVPVILF